MLYFESSTKELSKKYNEEGESNNKQVAIYSGKLKEKEKREFLKTVEVTLKKMSIHLNTQ